MQTDKIINDSQKVPEIIMESLISSIEKGDIEVGRELPPERELAEKLQVSRNSLREALAILEFVGAIESNGYRKVLVRDGDYIKRVHSMVDTISDSGAQQLVHEFRRVIEVGCVAIACQKATDDDIEQMGEAIKALENNPGVYENDVRFHNTVAKATHNPMLFSTLQLINNFVSEIRIRYYDKPGYLDRTLASHKAIYEAIVERDPERAQLEMIMHLNLAAEYGNKYSEERILSE